MARLPRYIIPGQPQHIIQRGNNRQPIFAAAADYAFFRDVLVEAASKKKIECENRGQTTVFPCL